MQWFFSLNLVLDIEEILKYMFQVSFILYKRLKGGKEKGEANLQRNLYQAPDRASLAKFHESEVKTCSKDKSSIGAE